MANATRLAHVTGTSVVPATGRARTAPTSLERIEWVIGFDANPVRRNLLITQSYHDISVALGHALGAENANWCTFATWASQTAGRFMRNDEIPLPIRLLLGRSEPAHLTIAGIKATLNRTDRDSSFDDDSIVGIVREIVQDVGRLVAAGNLAVYAELGPVFSHALAALAGDEGPGALDALAETLRPQPSETGGQQLLRQALRNYAAARAEPDPGNKAARMLLANGQVGLHEQMRLQPFIAASLDAPIGDATAEALEQIGQALPAPLATEIRRITKRLGRPIAHAAARLWEAFATRQLMTLSLPDGELLLGSPLPAPRGQPLYPSLLDPVSDAETTTFLARHGADRGITPAGATDWAQLAERMRYILDLFRSRQRDTALQSAPFTAAQQEALLNET